MAGSVSISKGPWWMLGFQPCHYITKHVQSSTIGSAGAFQSFRVSCFKICLEARTNIDTLRDR